MESGPIIPHRVKREETADKYIQMYNRKQINNSPFSSSGSISSGPCSARLKGNDHPVLQPGSRRKNPLSLDNPLFLARNAPAHSVLDCYHSPGVPFYYPKSGQSIPPSG